MTENTKISARGGMSVWKEQNYKKANKKSQTCIDNFDVEVLIEDDIIKDIRFDGEACAICTSSTSIMIDTLIGKNIEEAKQIIENFERAYNLPTTPTEHTYSENHIFDEDKSVKWNREEVVRRNEEIRWL